jgi:transcriptional regulator with XRE-family HTH domain
MTVKISLRAARINAGYSQKEAAERLGVTPKTLGNWENGTTFPSADKIVAICELYGVSYDNLNFLPTDSLKAKSHG